MYVAAGLHHKDRQGSFDEPPGCRLRGCWIGRDCLGRRQWRNKYKPHHCCGSLATLLDVVPIDAPTGTYDTAVIDGNVLGKSDGGRAPAYVALSGGGLYLLRPDSILFRALRDLWSDDPTAQPLLAGLCALARDSVFRASSTVILASSPGDVFTATDMSLAVGKQFPSNYSDGTLAKIGRNAFSSWEQTGHLAVGERNTKVRTRTRCCAANVTYAMLLGHLQGDRGHALFETLWARVLDQPRSRLVDLAVLASQQGMLEFRHGGGVIEVTFHATTTPVRR